jgi:hypothetical protein
MLKCLNCGKNSCDVVPDEEIEFGDTPPSFTARKLYCKNCELATWSEVEDLGLEEWPELQQASA